MADAPTFPWQMFLAAQQAKNQNQQQMNQDIAGIGQGLGGGLASIGEIIGDQKKKALLAQILQQQKNQTTPIQGPQGYVPPNQGPVSTAVPAGQVPPVNPQKMQSLLTQYDPQGMMPLLEKQSMSSAGSPYIAKLNQMYPQFGGALTQENVGQLLPSAMKNPPNEWSPYPGTFDGKPAEMNKATGEVLPVNAKGKYSAPSNYGNTMGPIRQHQYTMQDLPSNQGPSTAGGAAYQVLVASQQGMNLIAKPGSPQRTGLATGDLARAILRNSPTDETLRNANFSDTLVQRWSALKQKVSADPSSVENPQIRKEMYDIFSEMRQSALPFVQNQLDDMADNGFPVSEQTRKRQLGQTLPIIPFQDDGTPQQKKGYSDPDKERRYQQWLQAHSAQ